jgi:hypothetical protein
MKALMVMCCGCGHLLNKDGSVGPQIAFDGVLSYDAVLKLSDAEKTAIASFDTRFECDAVATKAGWATYDREGPNHRCPKCLKIHNERVEADRIADPPRRGAYLSTSLLERVL